eukprot:gene14214-biopygen3212
MKAERMVPMTVFPLVEKLGKWRAESKGRSSVDPLVGMMELHWVVDSVEMLAAKRVVRSVVGKVTRWADQLDSTKAVLMVELTAELSADLMDGL